MKPSFEEINYNSDVICWGHGNNLVGPVLLASISFKNETKCELRLRLDKLKVAKDIYDKHINKGSVFRVVGDRANNKIIAEITFINKNKFSVTWKQINLTSEQIEHGYKPACGKWDISAFIKMCNGGYVEFVN